MQKSRVRRAGALLVGLAVVAAACGSDKKATPATTPATTPGTTVPATTPVTTPVSTPVTTPVTGGGDTTIPAPTGDLEGFKGTTPLVQLSQDFKDRLATVPSGKALKDYNYAAETYDAIVVIALAAEQAKSDGSALAKE